jgi:hypothetical protein
MTEPNPNGDENGQLGRRCRKSRLLRRVSKCLQRFFAGVRDRRLVVLLIAPFFLGGLFWGCRELELSSQYTLRLIWKTLGAVFFSALLTIIFFTLVIVVIRLVSCIRNRRKVWKRRQQRKQGKSVQGQSGSSAGTGMADATSDDPKPPENEE